jgi:hypothetical protein
MNGVSYPSGAGNIGNGTNGAFSRDNFGRTMGISWRRTSDSALITSDSVTRSRTGRVLTNTVDGASTPTWSYSYDGPGRLTQAAGNLPGTPGVPGAAPVARTPSSTAVTAGAGATSLSLTRPSSAVAGDVLVASVAFGSGPVSDRYSGGCAGVSCSDVEHHIHGIDLPERSRGNSGW